MTDKRYEMISHVMEVLEECKGSRIKTANKLNTSKTNITNWIKEANEKYDMGIDEIVSNRYISENKNRIFPTNKERIRYLNNPIPR